MFRLIILLGSCLTLFIVTSQVTSAQSTKPEIKLPKVPRTNLVPNCPPIPRLQVTLESQGPIKITNEMIKQTNEYENYLKELNQWQLDALNVAEQLEKDGKLYPTQKPDSSLNNPLAVSPIHAWRRQISLSPTTKVAFPPSVINEMQTRPATVSSPTPTESTLVLKLTNISFSDIAINGDIFCDLCNVKISVTGPEAYRIPNSQLMQTADWRQGRAVILKPEQSHEIELKHLRFGKRGTEGWSLRRPGTHQVTVTYNIESGNKSRSDVYLSKYTTAKTSIEVQVAESLANDSIATERPNQVQDNCLSQFATVGN